MWLQDFIKVGVAVERADNPTQTGVCIAVFGFDGRSTQAQAASVFRISWDNGWREDCTRDEIERRFA